MPDNGSRGAYYASRPLLRVNGQVQPSLAEHLVSLFVEETTLGLFRCEASFNNWGTRQGQVGFLYFERDVLDFAKTISVELGPPEESGPVFAGRITGIEALFPPARPPELLILAEDRFQDLRMTRRTRTFENLSDADVIRQVASPHGLTAQVDVDGPTYRLLAQVNQSDLAFLRERAAAIDAELWIDNRTLYAQARSRRSAGRFTFTYGVDLLEFSVLADLAHQRTQVRVSGWDVGEKRAIDEQAGAGAISSELGGRRGGGAVLEALGRRPEVLSLSVPLSSQEARALAEARYRARARAFVRGRGLVDGNVRLRVGSTVELSGLGPMFEGPYYVTLARHTFDRRQGYRTEFEAERPGIGG